MRSWLTDSFPYCYDAATTRGYDCREPALLYFASLYHTLLCLFGGLEATPGNGVEMFMGTLLMLLSGLVWSWVMGTVIDIVSVSDPEESDFRSNMDALNRYMARERMPPDLRCRAREYFNKSKHVRSSETRKDLLDLMPESLQASFILHTSKDWMDQVWFLADLSSDEEDVRFVVAFAKACIAMVFAPGDWAPSGRFYIIHRGIALYRAQVLSRGRVFGEDYLLESSAVNERAAGRAINYLEVYCSTREDVLEIGERFPSAMKKVRKRVLLRTMRTVISREKNRIAESLNEYRAQAGALRDLSRQLGTGQLAPIELQLPASRDDDSARGDSGRWKEDRREVEGGHRRGAADEAAHERVYAKQRAPQPISRHDLGEFTAYGSGALPDTIRASQLGYQPGSQRSPKPSTLPHPTGLTATWPATTRRPAPVNTAAEMDGEHLMADAYYERGRSPRSTDGGSGRRGERYEEVFHYPEHDRPRSVDASGLDNDAMVGVQRGAGGGSAGRPNGLRAALAMLRSSSKLQGDKTPDLEGGGTGVGAGSVTQMLELAQIIGDNPQYKYEIQEIIQRKDLTEQAKMQAVQRIVQETGGGGDTNHHAGDDRERPRAHERASRDDSLARSSGSPLRSAGPFGGALRGMRGTPSRAQIGDSTESNAYERGSERESVQHEHRDAETRATRQAAVVSRGERLYEYRSPDHLRDDHHGRLPSSGGYEYDGRKRGGGDYVYTEGNRRPGDDYDDYDRRLPSPRDRYTEARREYGDGRSRPERDHPDRSYDESTTAPATRRAQHGEESTPRREDRDRRPPPRGGVGGTGW